jgi:hypothetical protein
MAKNNMKIEERAGKDAFNNMDKHVKRAEEIMAKDSDIWKRLGIKSGGAMESKPELKAKYETLQKQFETLQNENTELKNKKGLFFWKK